MDGQSLNITQDLITKLKEIIPGAFTEDKLNIEQLKQLLGEDINTDNERYQLNWAGKNEAYKVLQAPTTETLNPCFETSINWDNAQNIFIEGENLQVLKILQKSYYGKIKMIYVDPPYNTGSDSFIYPDKFSESKDDYLKRVGDMDETGFLTNEGFFKKNNRENGKFHSNWLNMILPRLFLARNLLTQDGIIFISIDDNEQSNLKLLLDEIFGQECFIGTLPRLTKKSGKSTESLARNHDYVLVYGKNDNAILRGTLHTDVGFSHQDEFFEQRGAFKLNQTLDYNTLGYVKSLDYEIEINGKTFYPGSVNKDEWQERRNKNPKDGYRWRWSKELFDFGLLNGFIIIKDTGRIYTKTYQNCTIKNINGQYEIIYTERTKSMTSIDLISNEYSNDNSRKNIVSTFGEAIFEYSKPVDLVRKLVEVATSGDDIILDFFSGSGTTAEAVLKQNEIDKQNRRFICVQLPEETETDSLAFQRGFKNIAQISIERIKICLSKTNNSNISKLNFENNIELGCRHFKLSNSNFKQWQSNVNNNKNTLIQQILKFDKTENTNSEITNILWELLVKLGFSLDSKVISEQMSDIETIYYNENVSYAFLLNSVSDAILNRIINLSPQNVICLDSLFKNQDSKKTNFILKLEQHNISFKSI